MNKSNENPLSPQYGDEIKEVLKLLSESKDFDVSLKKEDSTTSHTEDDKDMELRERKQNLEERKKYAGEFISLAKYWLCFIGAVIVLNGLSYNKSSGFIDISFSIGDMVILALLCTSLVNILTPAFLVATYLFNTSRKNSP